MATDMDLEGQERFFEHFIEKRGDFIQALKDAEIPRKTFYRWLRDDESFKDRYDKFRLSLGEEIENEAVRRVLNPTANRGSDALVTKLLGGLRPERYAEKKSDAAPQTVVFISGLRDTPRPGVKDAEFAVPDPDAAQEPGPDPERLRVVSGGVDAPEGVLDAAGDDRGTQISLFEGIDAPQPYAGADGPGGGS